MATVLDKRYTHHDTTRAILAAALKLATDDNRRVLLSDDTEWKQRKLTEIARLLRIVVRRTK